MHLTYWILPALLVVVWAQPWWRNSRRFRLWFALLAPFACVVGIIVGLLGSTADGDGGCAKPCKGGLVQHWAGSVDSSSAFAASSALALFVAVALTIVTLIVEYVLLVRRDSADASPDGDTD